MRIISGRVRGLVLQAPAGKGTRPTLQRVKENVFNILAHNLLPQGFAGLRVLDLFAGSGQLGLEAYSRGAASVTAVENDAEALKALRHNVHRAKAEAAYTVVDAPAAMFVRTCVTGFDVVFCDPPYQYAAAALRLIETLPAAGLLYIESDAGAEAPRPHGLDPVDERVYGKSRCSFFDAAGGAASG